MRPLKLTIEGINSFLSPQTVDFEAAGADNLFCISGSTGSGKTTVLDCIILSLYLNHSERGNLSDYINLRCDEGRITFIFELEGEIYETRRVISRKQGKNSMLLLKGGAPVAEGEEAYRILGEKIGLEVKEFTNVVVLQQGEFSRFLKAKKAERVALINKLFDLKRFDGLYGKFNARLKTLTALSEACDKSLESFALVSDKTVEENEKAAAEKEKQAVAAEKEAETFQKTASETRKKAEDYAALIKLKEEIAAAEKELSVLSEREKKGNEYKKALSERESALKAREEKRDSLVARRAEIVQTDELLKDIEKKEAGIVLQRAEAAKKASSVAEKEEKLKRLRADCDSAQSEVKKFAADETIAKSGAEENLKTFAVLGAESCRRDIADALKAAKEAKDASEKLAAADTDDDVAAALAGERTQAFDLGVGAFAAERLEGKHRPLVLEAALDGGSHALDRRGAGDAECARSEGRRMGAELGYGAGPLDVPAGTLIYTGHAFSFCLSPMRTPNILVKTPTCAVRVSVSGLVVEVSPRVDRKTENSRRRSGGCAVFSTPQRGERTFYARKKAHCA